MDAGDLGTTAAIAAFLVPIVSWIKRPTWGSKANAVLAMVAALVAAIAGAVVDGKLTWSSEFISQIGVAFATSQVVYQLYFKETGLNTTLTNK